MSSPGVTWSKLTKPTGVVNTGTEHAIGSRTLVSAPKLENFAGTKTASKCVELVDIILKITKITRVAHSFVCDLIVTLTDDDEFDACVKSTDVLVYKVQIVVVYVVLIKWTN